jgi:hypothetical protein
MYSPVTKTRAPWVRGTRVSSAQNARARGDVMQPPTSSMRRGLTVHQSADETGSISRRDADVPIVTSLTLLLGLCRIRRSFYALDRSWVFRCDPRIPFGTPLHKRSV